ncbi:hypothetical protein B4U79_13845 [Dinothrombium tinctorium]|uniref:SUZ RNA-binding domain-containing n=1 Tax=Dinothrombium tinctorium TaxID=1965070 RepID=A0A443QNL9_9ACAR|nr:hypothetical protein B4U79_02301 [Dinothrombium tinctorium]RWS06419.1 hypothetical protein B4U79_10281 [Dinothrombium tinctorium]RWS09654.1 hypothetical protein B4U79_13845 [Dinothrombium tinctorium]
MAEDVCDVLDSWEDIIENGVLDLKISQMSAAHNAAATNFSSSSTQSSNATRCLPSFDQRKPTPVAVNVDNGGNSIKILKRPANGSNTKQTSSSAPFLSNSSKSYDLNNYVNSEPFVPQNYQSGNETNPRVLQYPQITLEDTTRTQYVPQVKILKRPKERVSGDGNKVSPVKNHNNQGKNTSVKSYEEREAEYAKARLRILGSAVPTYDANDSRIDETSNDNSGTVLNPGPSKVNGDVNKSSVEVPIIRMPQGPDGSKGFAVKR